MARSEIREHLKESSYELLHATRREHPLHSDILRARIDELADSLFHLNSKMPFLKELTTKQGAEATRLELYGFVPAAFRHNEGRVNEAFFFIECTSVAKFVGDIRQHSTQNFIAAPSLKAPMYGFVVRIALRQHVPLRTGVEIHLHAESHRL
jgi:hypothetical protein